MTIVSFINLAQRDVINNILTHCGLASRAPPPEARGPPAPSPKWPGQGLSQGPPGQAPKSNGL
jgi:hypothetical protein